MKFFILIFLFVIMTSCAVIDLGRDIIKNTRKNVGEKYELTMGNYFKDPRTYVMWERYYMPLDDKAHYSFSVSCKKDQVLGKYDWSVDFSYLKAF